jgi:hypothetical protein
VEVRAALVTPDARVTAATADPLQFVVDDGAHSVYVVGHPPTDAIRAAVMDAGAGAEVVAAPESRDAVVAALPGWPVDLITVHTLPPGVALPLPDGPVRLLAATEVVGLDAPPDLCAELLAAARTDTPIAAAFEDGRPVAFCYAGSRSDRYWDVSIDTLEGYRRRGLAARAATFEAARQAREGREPVWCSAASNPASAALAARLGFVPVDTLIGMQAFT